MFNRRFDLNKTHDIIIRERQILEEGLPIYAYRQKKTVANTSSTCIFLYMLGKICIFYYNSTTCIFPSMFEKIFFVVVICLCDHENRNKL